METGQKGKRAIVGAASKGLGRASATALAREDVDVVITAGTLERAAAKIAAACVFLCAASSGFIVGQYLLLDGGAFNSTMG
jgi:NAD(P)-dependent dehydrogenase (short-subunit alcohol dehydrogenase family)